MAVSSANHYKVVLIEQNIARLRVDLIVNFERYHNLTGGDLHKLLHKDAGPGLKDECSGRWLHDGEVLLTGAHKIYWAKGIIHAVVPIILFSFSKKDGATLGLCHERALDVAREKELRTIAFPCMYSFYACKQASVNAALEAVKNYLRRPTGDMARLSAASLQIDTILFCSADKDDTDAYRAGLLKYFPNFVDAARLPIILGKDYVIDYTVVFKVGQFVYFDKEIGRGAFGAVYKGRCKKTRADVAVKVINCNGLGEINNIAVEIDILKKLSGSSEHLVSVYDVHHTSSRISIVMELCNAGDLHDHIKSKPEKRLHEEELRHFLRHIVSAMKAMRQMNVVHRDLKPQNMLLHQQKRSEGVPSTFNLTLKIADFGVSRYLSEDAAATTVAGTPVYMAPELLQAYLNRRHGAYTASVDLWSIGVVLYECLTGKRPFQGEDLTKLCNHATGFMSRSLSLPISLPQAASRPLQGLITGLLQPRSECRMSFDEFYFFSDKFCMASAREANEGI